MTDSSEEHSRSSKKKSEPQTIQEFQEAFLTSLELIFFSEKEGLAFVLQDKDIWKMTRLREE